MKFIFKGDGASADTTVFGVTFPIGVGVPHTELTDEQALLLVGNPMFDKEEDGPAPKVVPSAPAAPEPEKA